MSITSSFDFELIKFSLTLSPCFFLSLFWDCQKVSVGILSLVMPLILFKWSVLAESLTEDLCSEWFLMIKNYAQTQCDHFHPEPNNLKSIVRTIAYFLIQNTLWYSRRRIIVYRITPGAPEWLLVECPNLELCSGLDLRVMSLGPCWAPQWA